MNKSLIALIAIGLIALVIVGMMIGAYNSLVNADANTKSTFSEVRNQYQRQADLIPNVVNTVKGYMAFESGLLQNITNAQTQWQNAVGSSTLQQDAAGTAVSSAIGQFLVTWTNYPELKSNTLVTQLVDELEGTQNRITVARGRYITSVNDYNVMVRSFPSNIFAGMFGFTVKDYYQGTASTEPPVVDLGI
jgi:LemA protein